MNRAANNENRNTLNVSVKKKKKCWRPSIKVGYQSQRSVENSQIEVSLVGQHHQPTRNRKNQETDKNQPERVSTRRHIAANDRTEIFNISECSGSHVRHESLLPSSKGMRAESYRRYHASSLFNKQPAEPQQSSRVSQQSHRQLPSYQDSGISQILQYKHAKPYRATPLTDKCNNVPASRRQVSYSQLHDYDFRHRPQQF